MRSINCNVTARDIAVHNHQMYFCVKADVMLTWHFEGDHILQQAGILGLFRQCVRSYSKLVLIKPGDPESCSQPVSTVAHGFGCGELGHSRKLQAAQMTVNENTVHGLLVGRLLGISGESHTSGERWASRMLLSRPSLCPRVFALLRDSMVFLIFRLWRIGTSDMNSSPPATTASHWPAAIRPTAAERGGGGKGQAKVKLEFFFCVFTCLLYF